MVASTKLNSLCGQGFHGLNQAVLILLPKTSDASTLRDYHPINIIHIFAKVVVKTLVSRLSPKLGGSVEENQCTVIKKRCIHDNFMLVQQTRYLHQMGESHAMLKLDITHAFDSVS